MPGAVIDAPDVSAAWSQLADSLSWDIFDATAETATAGAIAGDGAGAGLTIIAGAVEADPVIDLAAIIIGFALLIIAFAIAILLLRPLGWVLGHIPLVGGAIQDALDNASDAIWNFVKGLVGDALRGIWWFLKHLWAITIGFPMAVGHTLTAIATFVSWVANTQVPWAVGVAQDDANRAQNNATNYAWSLGQSILDTARGWFGQALNYATQVWQSATSYASSLFNQATGYAASLFNNAVSYTTNVYHAVETDLSNGINWAEQQAANMFRTAEQDIANLAHTTEVEIGNAVQELTGLFTGALTATTALLGTEIAQTAATAATATQTVEQKLQKYLDECGLPICDNLSDLSNSIPNLLAIFDDVAIAALIADLIHNPAAVAEDVKEFVVTPMRDALAVVGVG
jgi:hypothetical protein